MRAICLAVAALAVSCAEPVEDIDRTQGNLLRKADLDGEWYYMQTIVSVPSTSVATFVGETSWTERVRWEFQRDALIAWRSYEIVPGSGAVTVGERDERYAPVAVFSVESHVDVTRDYDPASGEQSNVIRENTEDRLWHEREYARVDWSHNQVANFDFVAPAQHVTSLAYFVEPERDDPDAFYTERDETGALRYFDSLGKFLIDPGMWDWYGEWEPEPSCWYYPWAVVEDCASAEVEVRHSFARVDPTHRYEPFQYDDTLQSRFGYFRTERYTHDEQRGLTDAGRSYLINRFDIWKQSYTEDGTPIPLPDREVRTIPYYLNVGFPTDEPEIMAAAQETLDQWNEAGKAAVAAAQGIPASESPDVFVLCANPVPEGAHAGCGEVGFSPRVGDLRYSTLHWVDELQLEGPLGYGPGANDPLTGEILSGKVYVYAGGLNAWANNAVDVIRYFNDELDLEALATGEYFEDGIVARLQGRTHAASASAKLDRIPVGRSMRKDGRRKQAIPRERRRAFDAAAVEQRLETARASGATQMLQHPELQKAVSSRYGAVSDLPEQARAALDPTRITGPEAARRRRAVMKRARSRNVALRDLVAPDIAGFVQRYAGRTDYEQIWKELRAEIFASTAEHEVGHSLGLTHNYGGSYDSLNYPDGYWPLREETLAPIDTIGDLYAQLQPTAAQQEGGMRQQQYASIMDYAYGWQSDLGGIGKYDAAAVLFGYSAGYQKASGDRCERYPSVEAGDGCLAQLPGAVEVFSKSRGDLGEAGALLSRGEAGYAYDDPGLPLITLLERHHYANVASAFPSLDDINDREVMGYADFLEQRGGADPQLRVPYIYCAEEWETALISCHAYDQGADPLESVMTKINHYRAYYPFANYRRDRAFFDPFDLYWSYLGRVFLPISEYYQNWYYAPFGDDPAYDAAWELSINAGFNLLAEVIATPPYGTWCERPNGRLLHLSDDPVTQGQVSDDDCLEDGRRVFLEPGVGRRRFSFFDPAEGYLFAWKGQEAGHYWATLAAAEALTDPEAYLVGVDGDAGFFSVTYYDWFEREFTSLVNRLLLVDYESFAPVAMPGETVEVEGEEAIQAALRYRPVAPGFDPETGLEFDPETGAEIPARMGHLGLCQPCERDEQCGGSTGFVGGIFCQPIDDERTYCLQDCSDGDDCPDGTACDDVGNCVPERGRCARLVADCDAENPNGRCAPGESCVDGACRWQPLVEAEPTFILQTELLWYGMLYTTSSYSTRFNDGLHVFRPGTDGVESDRRAVERHEFVNPLTGVPYAAVQPRCVTDGHLGLCAGCEADTDCRGYTGFLGGVYCQPLAEDDDDFFCLRDCSEDEAACPAGTTCDAIGNCVPDTCDAPAACSDENPEGTCPAGMACFEGLCVNSQCAATGRQDTGAVALVKRANALSARYGETLRAWYEDGVPAAEEERRGVAFQRARFELTNHVDLLETLMATYGLFGRVY